MPATVATKTKPRCILLEKTVELLKSCGKSPAVLAKETGLPFYWINSVRYNEELDPSVSRVCALYEHLSGKKLEV